MSAGRSPAAAAPPPIGVGSSCAERDAEAEVELVGARHPITGAEAGWVDVLVAPDWPRSGSDFDREVGT